MWIYHQERKPSSEPSSMLELSTGAVIEVIPGKAPDEGKFHVTATYNKNQACEYAHVLITHPNAADAGHYLEVLAHKLGALRTGDLHLVEIIRD